MKRHNVPALLLQGWILASLIVVGCNRKSSKRATPVYELSQAIYTDTNDNGQVDLGDLVTLVFPNGVGLQGTPAADSAFTLDPVGSFGAGAVVTSLSPTELQIVIQIGASLQPNGLYAVQPGASGVNLATAQTVVLDPLGTPISPRTVPVDIQGDARPRITTVRLLDFNGNCRLDDGDAIEAIFSANVTVTTPDPAQAFVLPVTGDSLGTGSQYPGGIAPANVSSVIIVLGTGSVFEPVGTFDPLNLLPGSPSGIDVTGTLGIVVDAANATVSARQATPPGLDIPDANITDLLWISVGDDQVGAGYGHSLASAGDVNGDGFGDVIVGAPGWPVGSGGPGKAFVYLGDSAGLATQPVWTSTGDGQAGAGFGSSVSTAGDVNGDGFDDIIVGAESFGPGAGKAYVYLGGINGPDTTPIWTSSGDQLGADRYGVKVDSAGDVNFDGFGDIVVSASHYPSTTSFVGKVYVYHGSSSGPSLTEDWWSIGDDQRQANFGFGCAGAGDVNNDSFDDIIVGAPGYDTTNGNAGKIYVYSGSLTGLGNTPLWTTSAEDIGGSQVGYSVGSAGDVNNDSFDDVIVGANVFGANTGKAYVYLGGVSGPAANFVWSSVGDNQPDAWFGTHVSRAGDVNQDGFDDIFVGAFEFSTTFNDAGKAYIFLGGMTGPDTIASWTSSGDDQADAWFGLSGTTAGDVNGDGFPELLVGANRFDTPTNGDAGKDFLYCVRP
ncbi:MAG: integrin alpha [Planctomycetota bacterium]|nr:integrin alpha [Planctomycetota bacterium]